MTDIKLMTRKQVTQIVGISRATLYRELKAANITLPTRKLLKPSDYEPVFAYFKDPLSAMQV